MSTMAIQRKLFDAVAILLIGGKALQVVVNHFRGRSPKPRKIDRVTQASVESFPASDAPSFNPGST